MVTACRAIATTDVPKIPLGNASYDRADLPRVSLVNLSYETNPSNLEDQVSLIPRPRLNLFGTAGSGPINGIYRKGGVLDLVGNSGKVFVLSGNQLYKLDQTTGATILNLGTVEGTASRMSAEGNESALVLACGTKVYSTDGSTLTQISFPDSQNVFAVDTLNSYFLFCGEAGKFYWSAIGGTTVSALDYATAESQPDVLMTLKVIGDELWLFGRLSIEVWQPTGNLDLPFQRISGRIFGIGITARDTCQKLNVNGVDKVAWMGTDRRIYMTNPNPQRISTPWLEEKLRTVGASTPYAATYSWNGHDYYILHIVGDGSFAYDMTTGLWDEVTSFNHPNFRGACSATGINAQPLLGDDTTGKIWQMVDTQSTDDTDPVIFEWTGMLEVVGAPVRCNNLSLDVATGKTTSPTDDPMVQMSWSDDLGEAFEDGEDVPLGRQGERNERVMWTQLGQLRRPGRLFRFRTTEPVTVRKAVYNGSYR